MLQAKKKSKWKDELERYRRDINRNLGVKLDGEISKSDYLVQDDLAN